MEKSFHSMSGLFAQLGLPSAPDEIGRFIAANGHLPVNLALHEAPCWNHAQSTFLRESIQLDADWAEVVDSLNIALRKP